MRSLILAILLIPSAAGEDSIDAKLGANWQPASTLPSEDGSSWQIWKNERGDLLTIAANSQPRKLTSDGDLDRAMDFASSASPRWLDTADFPCWGHDGREFDPRFLKLQKSFVRRPTDKKKRIPAISYVMVNEESDRSFIVVGAVVCVGSTTYYIQHNSKRPISDAIVKRVLRRVVESVPAPQQ